MKRFQSYLTGIEMNTLESIYGIEIDVPIVPYWN